MLLPRYFKFIGWVLAIPGIVIGILFQVSDHILPFLNYHGGRRKNFIIKNYWENNFTDELAMTLVIAGLLFIGFSKLKKESSYTGQLRKRALYQTFIFYNAAFVVLLPTFYEINFSFDTGSIKELLLDNYLPFLLISFVSRFIYLLLRQAQPAELKALSYRPFNLIGKISTAGIALLIIYNSVSGKNDHLVIWLLYALLGSVLIWAGSKEKSEGEFDLSLRAKALQISVYINYSVFLITTWAIYDSDYLSVLMVGFISIQFLYLVLFYGIKYFSSASAQRAIPIQQV